MSRKNQQLIEAPSDSNYLCEGQLKAGSQCRYLSIPGLVHEGFLDLPIKDVQHIKTCPKHGGNLAITHVEKAKLHDYRVGQWANRLNELSESPQIKTLRGEIGVLRLLVEQIFNACKNETDLILYSSKIESLVNKINTLVVSADKLETNLGMVMDKTQALNFASKIIAVIQKHVTDPEQVNAISEEMIGSLASLGEEPKCLV